MRHQPRAEHAGGVLTDLVGAARELDAARLAATAGVHLGLDDPEITAELFGRGGGGIGRLRRDSSGHGDAEIGK